jgi:superfamily II DNA or RNA helicase
MIKSFSHTMTSKIKASLTRSGIYIKYSEFQKAFGDEDLLVIKGIMAKFSLKHKTFKTHFITLNGFKTTRIEGTKYLRLPRFGFFDLFRNSTRINRTKMSLDNFIIDNQITIPKKISSLNWTGELRVNQPLCFDEIMRRYSSENTATGIAGTILNLEAGQGKTFVAMGLIDKLKQKTMIVTHTKTILYQWVDLLKEYFPKSNIGIYHGEKRIDGDIVVSVINSLMLDEIVFRGEKKKIIKGYANPLDYFSQFGMLIVDESHEYCSKERGGLFWKFQCPYMLGLSATPNERGDKFDPYVHWQMGPVLDATTLTGYSEDEIPFTGAVKMVKYVGPNIYTETIINEEYDMVNSAATINQMIGDPYRMHTIASELQLLIASKHNTFIFSDRKDYLDKIKEYLNHLNIDNNIVTTKAEEASVMKVVGGASADDVQNARDTATVILTTYQYAGTGCSIPKMNAVILATPRKSKSRQTINRIFRLGSNYEVERQIIDIVDWATLYKNQWYKRKKYYVEKGYPITTDLQKWEDIELISVLKDQDEAFKSQYSKKN